MQKSKNPIAIASNPANTAVFAVEAFFLAENHINQTHQSNEWEDRVTKNNTVKF